MLAELLDRRQAAGAGPPALELLADLRGESVQLAAQVGDAALGLVGQEAQADVALGEGPEHPLGDAVRRVGRGPQVRRVEVLARGQAFERLELRGGRRRLVEMKK